MIKPPTPHDEAARLCTLCALNILDTPAEERFDRHTRLARHVFDVPIALVSLVDADRQWFKSRQGLDATETPREISFCGHAILGDQTMVVSDARSDVRFHDNPLVRGAPNIRFYAGHPLQAPDGARLGTLCVIDNEPRDLDAREVEVLADLGRVVEAEFAALAQTTLDPLTGLSNRRGLEAVARHVLPLCERGGIDATLLYIDLDDFKPVNDCFGHAEGDRALREFSALLLECFRDSDVVARLGGDEFCVLISGNSAHGPRSAADRFAQVLEARNATPGVAYPLACSVGVVAWDPRSDPSPEALLDRADREMYAVKTAKRDSGRHSSSRR